MRCSPVVLVTGPFQLNPAGPGVTAVSPGKTWEGVYGAIAGVVVYGVVLAWVANAHDTPITRFFDDGTALAAVLAMVALTGRNEAYYSDHLGTPQEFISAAKYGYLFQGQRYSWQDHRRGTPGFDLAPWRFVNYTQNHDQIANSGHGLRCRELASPGRYRAVTACLLLFPGTPMLFQGQEFASGRPFHYFADHSSELAEMVRAGRRKELSQFPSIATTQMTAQLPDPESEQTFRRSVLDPSERTKPGHAEVLALHTDLLRLRREEPVFRRVQRRGDIDGAVLAPQAFVLRYFGDGDHAGGNDRLLLVNFDIDLTLAPAPEPLLAPPLDRRWTV